MGNKQGKEEGAYPHDFGEAEGVHVHADQWGGAQEGYARHYGERPGPSSRHAAHRFSLSSGSRLTPEDFDLIKVLGKGSFGKVLLVRKKDTGKVYAMKVLKKGALIRRNQVEHTQSERNILMQIDHPFIVGLKFAFQTDDKLYLVMDYCGGGEMFYRLKRDKRLAEHEARLYAAEIVLAIEHLHKLDVVYRDLKPENVLFDETGHIRLTDFGLSKEAIKDDYSTHTFCGTPEYLAPEMLLNQGHGKAVDWWGLGTLLYEMIAGIPPFYSSNVNKMYERILTDRLTFPPHMSREARALLDGLLQRCVEDRLGSGVWDAEEIKSHPFFRDIDWKRLYYREIPAPYVPKQGEHFDPQLSTVTPIDSVVEEPNPLDNDPFVGFSYINEAHV